MALDQSAILSGTSIAATGGTARTLSTKGDTLGQNVLIVNEGLAFNLTKTINASVKEPKVSASAPAGYTQGRSIVKIIAPYSLGNGEITKNTVSIELSVDPETSAAEINELRNFAAQMLFEADYDSFWQTRSIG